MVVIMKPFTEQLVAIANHMQWRFKLKGDNITPEEVFAHNGLLPGIAKKANQMALLCAGADIGAQISEDKNSTLGKTVTFEKEQLSLPAILFIFDQIMEMSKLGDGLAISLDDLLYD